MRVTKQIKRLHKVLMAKLESIKRENIAESDIISMYDKLFDKTDSASVENIQKEASSTVLLGKESNRQAKSSSKKSKVSSFKL